MSIRKWQGSEAMGYVYVYDKDTDNFENTGLVGALFPTECRHEEEAGGVSAVTLRHPYDSLGKWKALEEGNILACECRVRTPPDLDETGAYAATAEVWTVKSTGLTKAQKTVYTKVNKNKKAGTLIAGREVYVLKKGAQRYLVSYEALKKKKVKRGKKKVTVWYYVWKRGWCIPATLEYSTVALIDDDTNGILTICPNPDSRTQFFRIQSVNYDMSSMLIEVYAPHISFDLNNVLTRYVNNGTVSGVDALDGMTDGMDHETDIEILTDIADTRTGIEWDDLTVTNAIQDPETGFAAIYGAEVLRDNQTIYLLHDVDSGQGIRVEHRKNLTGAHLTVNYDGLVTAIKPRGQNSNGTNLYLTDNAKDDGNYVYSQNAGTYGIRAMVLDVSEAKVDKNVSKAVARQRMRNAADAYFTSQQCDTPQVELTINFVELGKTVEYELYTGLETAFLYDTVTVAAAEYGIEAVAKVKRMTWDCLNERIISMTLGDVDRTQHIYSWQIAGGITGQKLLKHTVTITELSENIGDELDITKLSVIVESSAGHDIPSGTSVTLTARVFNGSEEVTDDIAASRFSWSRTVGGQSSVYATGVKSVTVPSVTDVTQFYVIISD